MNVAGTNLLRGQRFNRRLVLETVRQFGPLSRAEIARRTGLSPQTISNLIEQLVQAEILSVSGRRTAGQRGQPPIDLEINPAGAYSFGISFDEKRIIAIILDLGGTIRAQTEMPVSRPTPDVVLPLIEAAVSDLSHQVEVPRDRVWGAGVVIPALIARGQPTALGPTAVPSWVGFPLGENLSQRLGMPVLVDNDATAAAIGERLFGVGRELQDFFYIYAGVGLGGGLILAGQPYRGAHGMSGEVGHMVVAPAGKPCPCGNRGCLERYFSLTAAQASLDGPDAPGEHVDAEKLERALEKRDKRILHWLEETAGYCRTAITNIENLLDPQAIVIGGSFPDALLEALLQRIEPLPPSVSTRRDESIPRVVKAQTGLETRALGAAALIIFESMTPDFDLIQHGDGEPLDKLIPVT